jgi:hypothetical protein
VLTLSRTELDDMKSPVIKLVDVSLSIPVVLAETVSAPSSIPRALEIMEFVSISVSCRNTCSNTRLKFGVTVMVSV